MLSVEPNDIYLWGHNKNVGNSGNNVYKTLYHNMNGASREWAGASFVVHPTDVGALQGYLAKTAQGPQCAGHCMMWLPNAPTGKDTTLFHDMGITRSAALSSRRIRRYSAREVNMR